MHGTPVSDLQHDVVVANNEITGTLVYQHNTPITPYMGDGYYLALRYENIDPSLTELLVKIPIVSIYTDLLQADDKHTVFAIDPNLTTSFEVIQKRGSEEKRLVFDLTGLQFEQ